MYGQPNDNSVSHVIGAIVAIFTTAGLVLGPSGVALAHVDLIDSTPQPGQVFEVPPDAVQLEFTNGDIVETGTVIEVVDHHEHNIEVGEPEIDGAIVSAALPSGLEGEYQVRWRVVSSDGHPVDGTIDFGVGEGATGAWAEEPPHDEFSTDSADDAEETATSGPNGWLLIGATIVVALILAVTIKRRRKRTL